VTLGPFEPSRNLLTVNATHEPRAIEWLGWAVATLNLTALAASLKMQFNSTRHSAIKEWLKGIDYMQPKTGAIKVMYSSNGITGTVSY
jgi:hypothetical protein